MAIAAIAFSLSSLPSYNLNFINHRSLSPSFIPPLTLTSSSKTITPLTLSLSPHIRRHFPLCNSGGDFGDGGNFVGGGGGGDENFGEGGGHEEGDENKNKKDVLLVLSETGRSLESLPKDLVTAIEEGRIPVEIVRKFLELEKSPLVRWLLQFGGFKERLLADDLFLAKVAMECGVGIFTKVCSSFVDLKIFIHC